MSSFSDFHQNLFRLYEHYVGEPDSPKDVYGFWVFIAGYLLGAVGVIVFVVGYTGQVAQFEFRVSGVLAAIGLALCLFGIVLLLPVRRRGIQASVVGLFIALAGAASFGAVYPDHWYSHGRELTVEVVGLYATGIAIIAGVTALVPIVTGRKGMFVAEEGATEEPPIMTGDSLEGAQFAVFRDEEGDWKWHVLHLEALAESVSSAVTRPETESGIENVKSQIGSAGLMELTTSAFRLHEDREGTWQWTLARDDGSVVGSCASEFDRRDDAEQSVSFLKDRGPGADVIEIEGAAFTYTERRDQWYWQLLDDDRRPLAESEEGHASMDRAEAAAQTFAERFDRARLLDVDHVGVELLEEVDGWTWRFVDEADEELARSTTDFETRRAAEDAVEALLSVLESASVTVASEPTYECYESEAEDGWNWRLVDENEHVVAHSPSAHGSEAATTEETTAFADHATAASVVEIDDAEYEIYPTQRMAAADGGELQPVDTADTGADDTGADDESTGTDEPSVTQDWHWRLVTEGREVIAASTETHVGEDAAEDAIERVRQQASEADLIEFENAAFQVYEADFGEWRWRLIDEDGNVLADSGEEHTSRGDAAEAMMTLKEQAPEAELLEIDTAAFEIFTEDGEWGWRLIDEAGKMVAEDPASHPTRAAAKEAMERLLAHLDSSVRTMDDAIFQTYADQDWQWRFVLPSGETVAVSAEETSTRDELERAIDDVRETAANGQSTTVGDVSVQLYGSGSGEWRWRLLDRERTVVTDATRTYDSRGRVMSAVKGLKARADDAPIFTIDTAAIRLTDDDGWAWELIDADREVLASAVETERTKADAMAVVDEVRRRAPIAGRVDFDVASFELFADEDGRWRWRLIDENGRTVAVGSEGHASSETAQAALEDVRGLIANASILEIDSVSFELHRAEDGWVWRLIDTYGDVLAESTQSYEHRTDAREAMMAVKSHAPEGWITFTE
ncbi:DUF1508 domain-containing protein [Natronosalvus caseinilyticus]|uniref:DUF1508 domain-containing protein n=1 Tax=Natronosalvus caseinilyticus TaxID=2953747 RepID=UPI0028AEDFB0|nr:DUF1508 domain-containing protein [Natronosalvus caseinilyticus]